MNEVLSERPPLFGARDCVMILWRAMATMREATAIVAAMANL